MPIVYQPHSPDFAFFIKAGLHSFPCLSSRANDTATLILTICQKWQFCDLQLQVSQIHVHDQETQTCSHDSTGYARGGGVCRRGDVEVSSVSGNPLVR